MHATTAEPTATWSPDAYRARMAAHLKAAATLYPRAWRSFDQLRAMRTEKEIAWPDWCFCPIAGGHAIACAQHGTRDLNAYAAKLLRSRDPAAQVSSPTQAPSRLTGLAAWRPSQGIYLIDPVLRAALEATPLNGAIPTDVLLRLPQWAVYVATPDLAWETTRSCGFLAFLEHDAETKRTQLRILHDELVGVHGTTLPPFYSLQIDSLELEPGLTLHQSYAQGLENAIAAARKVDILPEAFLDYVTLMEERGPERLAPLLSLLCYLCSQTAEYRGAGQRLPSRPANAAARKTKEGWRMFPPERAQVWMVGEQLGAALRAAEAVPRGAEPGEERARPRFHVRGAHWHGFWSGPRADAARRRFELRWLPPIPVNLADDSPEARIRHERLKPIRDLEAQVENVTNELEERCCPRP